MAQAFVHLPVDRVIFSAGALSELPPAFDELRSGMNPRRVRDPDEILEILKAAL